MDGKGAEEETNWAIDRRPPRDRCGYKSSVRGVYGAGGGLGYDKRGITTQTLINENEIDQIADSSRKSHRKRLKFPGCDLMTFEDL